MSDKYYQAEFRYLVEAGKAFAKRFPELARELNLTDVSSRDPNVERLMEGFAFLSSRTRKRLDDDFPQLVEGLMAQIWPHHGRPVPSFCLLEFQPPPGPAGSGPGSAPGARRWRPRLWSRACAAATAPRPPCGSPPFRSAS